MLNKNKEPLPRRMVKCSEVQDFIESTSSLPLEQLDRFEALGLVSAAKNQKKRKSKAGKNTVATGKEEIQEVLTLQLKSVRMFCLNESYFFIVASSSIQMIFLSIFQALF